jgi:pyridoxal phosphate enzyme (YggS family)
VSRGTTDPAASRELAERIARVRAAIDRAARRAGRDSSSVLLVAAAKDVDAGAIAAAARCGATDVGENRAQELRSKQEALEGIPLRWHFIGVLQRNKVKDVVGVTLIHSVDSLELARAISRRAEKQGTSQDVLLEVNVGDESSKHGVALGDIPRIAESIVALEGIRLRGLMAVPPQADDPERARPFFASLREAGARLQAGFSDATELSMGMSADFEVAIEEGATIVRIGTAIFGPRPLH